MIRRGFWLTAGAVTGIYGYRRVSAIGRRLSARLNLSDPSAPARSRSRRGAAALAAQTCRFTRDVREGMELYRFAHPAPAVLTRGDDPPRPSRAGSTLSTDHTLATDHEPKDGH